VVTGVFSYRLRDGIDMEEYQAEAFRMFERLCSNAEFGFRDLKVYNAPDRYGLLVAQFDSVVGVRAWRDDPEHLPVQERGRREWYESYWGGHVVPHYEFDVQKGRQELPWEGHL
jgi:heme-degrading monooxygenase HmoA